jgi:hypothetical protein
VFTFTVQGGALTSSGLSSSGFSPSGNLTWRVVGDEHHRGHRLRR